MGVPVHREVIYFVDSVMRSWAFSSGRGVASSLPTAWLPAVRCKRSAGGTLKVQERAGKTRQRQGLARCGDAALASPWPPLGKEEILSPAFPVMISPFSRRSMAGAVLSDRLANEGAS